MDFDSDEYLRSDEFENGRITFSETDRKPEAAGCRKAVDEDAVESEESPSIYRQQAQRARPNFFLNTADALADVDVTSGADGRPSGDLTPLPRKLCRDERSTRFIRFLDSGFLGSR